MRSVGFSVSAGRDHELRDDGRQVGSRILDPLIKALHALALFEAHHKNRDLKQTAAVLRVPHCLSL